MIGFEREDAEILRYYEKVAPADMFGVWGEELLMRVPLAKAEKFMKKDHGWTPEAWEKCVRQKDHESVVNEIEDYFQFAWEKALQHRGRSASVSIFHFMAWAWLLNDMEIFSYAMEPRNYPNYGCPVILAVGQKYELLEFLPENPIDREVFMRMANGQVCSSMCNGGCRTSAPMAFHSNTILFPPSGTTLILPKSS